MKIGQTIYLDHQATTPLDPQVLNAMLPYLTEIFGNSHSSEHFIGWKAAEAVENAAKSVANLISGDKEFVVFTAGATEANNIAIHGVARHFASQKRKRILVSSIEHKCVLGACRFIQKEYGYQISYIPVSDQGFVNIDFLEDALKDDVLLVSIMAVNNEIGSIQDLTSISRLIHQHGAFFHCDAAQVPGSLLMDGLADIADLISLSGHKMSGPQGIGALYISQNLEGKIEPIIYGGGQQFGLRPGTLPVALCVGMGAACDLIKEPTIQSIYEQKRLLRDKFIKKLTSLSWPIKINGPTDELRHYGNVNVCFRDFNAQDILSSLQPHVAASSGAACSSGNMEPSHVLKAIGLSDSEASSSIRFSIGKETSEEDIDESLGHINYVLTKLSEL